MKYIIAALLMLSTSAFAGANVLTWDDVDGEDGYNVYEKPERCSAAVDNWAQLGTVGADVLTYTHVVNGIGVNHCYRVTAFNEHGESGYSNEAGKVPGVPNNLKVQ